MRSLSKIRLGEHPDVRVRGAIIHKVSVVQVFLLEPKDSPPCTDSFDNKVSIVQAFLLETKESPPCTDSFDNKVSVVQAFLLETKESPPWRGGFGRSLVEDGVGNYFKLQS